MSNTLDLLGLAIDKNPVDFASLADQLIRQKAVEAIDNKRVELAQAIYGDDSNEDEVDTVDTDDSDYDLDADGDEFEDDDEFDLDDLDLADLDLEDIDDDGQDA